MRKCHQRWAAFFEKLKRFYFPIARSRRERTVEDAYADLRESLRDRLRARVGALRKIKMFERRRSRQCERWMKRRPKLTAYPMYLYGPNDPAYLGPLNPEQEEAASGELTRRLVELAITARISRTEFDRMKYSIGLTAVDLFSG